MTLCTIAFASGCFALGLVQVLLAADAPKLIGFPKKGDPGGGIGAIRIWYEAERDTSVPAPRTASARRTRSWCSPVPSCATPR